MRIPDYLYKRIQTSFPDLFIIEKAAAAAAQSTVFTQFLPGAALADPAGSPWGSYGNRETPPKRKVVVISFQDLAKKTVNELLALDKIARFLKRAGFTVLIPMGDALEDYNQQLFDRSLIVNAGDKSRPEMQRMALARGLAADDLFFIDEGKTAVDKDWVDHFIAEAERIIYEKSDEDSYVSLASALSGSPGVIVGTLPKIGAPAAAVKNREDTQLLDEEEKRNKEREIAFLELIKTRLPEAEAEAFDNRYAISQLLEAGVDFNDLLKLEPNLRAEVFKNGFKISPLLKAGVDFNDLLKLESNLRVEVFTKWNSISQLLKADVDFNDLLKLEPNLRAGVFENGFQISDLLKAGVDFNDLLKLEPNLRAEMFENEIHISDLLKARVDFNDLLKLEPNLRAEVFKNGFKISELLEAGVDFNDLLKLEPNLRAEVFKNGFKISELLKEGVFRKEAADFERALQGNPLLPLLQLLKSANIISQKPISASADHLFRVGMSKNTVGDHSVFFADNKEKIEEMYLAQRTIYLQDLPAVVIYEDDAMVENFKLKAPKLILLRISVFGSANFQEIPLLNRLEIGVNSVAPLQIVVADTYLHLVELYIERANSLDFIIPLIKNAPNLRLIELEKSAIPERDLNDFCTRFPAITVHTISKETEPLRRLSDQAFTDEADLCAQASSFPDLTANSAAQSNGEVTEDQENCVYESIATASRIKLTFDTKHYAEETVTMKSLGRHLTKGKENRFEYTRISIVNLDLSHPDVFIPVLPHASSGYSLPPYIEKLPVDTAHDFFEFSEDVRLNPGVPYQLKSLSAVDQLYRLMLNGRPLSATDVDISKNDLGFYTITAKVMLSGKLSYVYDVLEAGLDYSVVPKELKRVIEDLQSFASSGVEALTVAETASPAEKIQAMYAQKKGACDHRVAIFLHELEKLKKTGLAQYKNIFARGVVRARAHINIELSTDGGKTFASLELSGYKVKKQYLPAALPALQFSKKQTQATDAVAKPDFQTVLRKIDINRGGNIFLSVQKPSDIRVCVSHIRQKAIESQRPIFYVDSPDAMRTSLKRLLLNEKRTVCEMTDPPAGLLHDFLMLYRESNPPPIIVVNWENFSASDIVQFNSVIDLAHRRVDNTFISDDATIVGLHSHNEKALDLLADTSFFSRHTKGGIYDFSDMVLPKVVLPPGAAAASSGAAPLKINLHNSPRWRELLLGKAYVDGRAIQWEDGALFALLKSSIMEVVLINPPKGDPSFLEFVSDLEAGLPLMCLNQPLDLRRQLIVTVTDKPVLIQKEDPIDLRRVNTLSESVLAEAFIINASTFEQCLHGKRVEDRDGSLVAMTGLLEAHKNNTLQLCLSGTLSDSQWSFLLAYAEKYNVTLSLFAVKEVSLPGGVTFNETAATTETSSDSGLTNRFIVSDDPERSVAMLQEQLKSSSPVKIIDLSEVSLDDLFCKTTHRVIEREFSFVKQFSAVWEALSRGETVILKGYCSPELRDYMASLFSATPYFYLEGEKKTFPGKLIVVAEATKEKMPAWLPVEQQKVKAESGQLFIQEQLSKRKPAEAASTAPLDPHDLSLAACEAFEKARVDAVKNVFSYSPFAVLEGVPGVGKSYFVRTLENDRSVKFYREDQIEAWATEVVAPGVQKILFRDEINLRGIDCAQDRDLLNNPPSIFVNGRYYLLTENHKILYAQNPLSYGGARREPKLFEDLPECKIVFEQMSRAFVLHRILKPIFITLFDGVESEARAKAIIEQSFDSMRSIRDLQTKAIFECAKEKEKRRAVAAGEEIAAAPVDRAMVCIGENGFILTASRYQPYEEVLTLLQARSFKRSLPETAAAGARFNGVNGLVLQGPPGVGKSEFIEAILKNEGYAGVDRKSAAAAGVATDKIYYRLRASVAVQEKLAILQEAFQKGAIVVIDEIDACPLLEDYLNAYLVGEDINGNRPEKPGFTLLSTANGAAMKGRRQLPAPLQSRMLALAFDEYPREDLISILVAKFMMPGDSPDQTLKQDMMAFLVDGFLTEQNTNKATPPTFRELMSVAEKYFTKHFARFVAAGLSKEQHQFMLVYHAHPKIEMLFRAMVLGQLGAVETLSIAQMDGELKKIASFGLFVAPQDSRAVEVDANAKPKPK